MTFSSREMKTRNRLYDNMDKRLERLLEILQNVYYRFAGRYET